MSGRKRPDPSYAPGGMQRPEAAWYCGVSVDLFDRYIRPDLPAIYIGSRRVWRRADLDLWLERNATAVQA